MARLRKAFNGDAAKAEAAGSQLGRTAILHDPWGYLRLGFHTYVECWQEVPRMKPILAKEHGAPTQPVVSESGARMISAVFGVDVSNQHTLQTPSRRYHLFGRYWNLVLLASPFLAVLTVWPRRNQSPACVALCIWSLLLFCATSLGASEVAYRYLHPFSFTVLAAAAILGETWMAESAPNRQARRSEKSAVLRGSHG